MSLAPLPLPESSKGKGNAFQHECNGKLLQTYLYFPVVGLGLAAHAPFALSQVFVWTRCLLRSAALSVRRTMRGTDTEIDLARNKKAKTKTISHLCGLANNCDRRNEGLQQSCDGVDGLSLKCYRVAAGMAVGVTL